MVIFFDLSIIVGVIVVFLLVCMGQLMFLFEWIANNKETLALIVGMVVLIKVIVFMYRNNGLDKKMAILLLCPVAHIPFVKFLFLLSYNVLNSPTGVIYGLFAVIGRTLTFALMVLYLFWTDHVFFRQKNWEEKERTIGNYFFHTIASVVFSVLTILLYNNF